MPNPDIAIMQFLNQFSSQSTPLSQFMLFLPSNALLKGGVLGVIIWWAWFKRRDDKPMWREHMIATLVGCLVAIVLGRLLVVLLPYRARPMSAEGLGFILPFGETPQSLGFEAQSSFPSDHAVMFFSLAVGLLYVSRAAGIFTMLFSLVVMSFPRVYLGYHYPSDILVGALIGAAIAVLANTLLTRTKPVEWVVTWSDTTPQLFYPLLFLLTFQISEMFSSSRDLAEAMYHALRGLIS